MLIGIPYKKSNDPGGHCCCLGPYPIHNGKIGKDSKNPILKLLQLWALLIKFVDIDLGGGFNPSENMIVKFDHETPSGDENKNHSKPPSM